MDVNERDFDAKLAERFDRLPKVVQDAITSANVEAHLRALAEKQRLHLDQWEKLENEVMLALLGFQPVDELAKNIQNEVRVDHQIAMDLAADISKIVFEPIREELERGLAHPQAKAEEVSAVEAVGAQALAQAAPQPATPPAPGPEKQAVRAPISENYRAGETSSSRASVHDDPYREPPA